MIFDLFGAKCKSQAAQSQFTSQGFLKTRYKISRKPLNPTKVKHLVVHCSATPPSASSVDAESIRSWHKQRGWVDIGYHFVITRNGEIQDGCPIEEIGAHVRGLNSISVGICLVGGIDEIGLAEANFTEAQYRSLSSLVETLKEKFPNTDVVGHRDLLKSRTKECPSFCVRSYFKEQKSKGVKNV